MIEIKPEPWEVAKDSCEELVTKNYDEISVEPERIPLDVDWWRYGELSRRGELICVIARENGKLVAYSLYFLSHPIHFKSTLVGVNDVLYIDPAYRGEGLGQAMIRFGEEACFQAGAIMVRMHAKYKNELIPLLRKMGYKDMEMSLYKMRE